VISFLPHINYNAVVVSIRPKKSLNITNISTLSYFKMYDIVTAEATYRGQSCA
jgi:hypothetical protein